MTLTKRILATAAFAFFGAATSNAQVVSLDTFYVGGNGHSGNMFDIQPNKNIVLRNIDVSISSGAHPVDVYYRSGGYVGESTSFANWTLAGSGIVPGLGAGIPSPVPFNLDIPIQAGERMGLYVTLTDGTTMDYTNGTTEGNLFVADSTLSIFEGIGVAYPTFENFSPRVWNGTLHYTIESNDCNGNGIPDNQDIATGFSQDCNTNGVPDECDIAEGAFLDIDSDGVLDECTPPALTADLYELSLSGGGVQSFTLRTGTSGDVYHMLGSLSGTNIGTSLLGATVPLNSDFYFLHTLHNPNRPPFTGGTGIMSFGPGGTGLSNAAFTLPSAPAVQALIGLRVYHAFVTYDGITGQVNFVSNTAPLLLVP